MSRKQQNAEGEPAREQVFEKMFGKLFGGSGRTPREERVREYVAHRLSGGAPLEQVLQESYVRRNCSHAQIDAIIRDPRVIYEDRMGLERFFENEELNPVRQQWR
jgi:hypothetical protein